MSIPVDSFVPLPVGVTRRDFVPERKTVVLIEDELRRLAVPVAAPFVPHIGVMLSAPHEK